MTAAADPPSAWTQAVRAAALFAIDPLQSGVALHAHAGPAREAWIVLLRAILPCRTPIRRAPLGVADDRLLGGLDLAATLRAGKAVAETGLMAQANGGVLQLAMAERLSAGAAARICMAMDCGEIGVERDGLAQRHAARFGIVALDEGCCIDERPPDALLDRLPFHIDLSAIGHREIEESAFTQKQIAQARAQLSAIEAGPHVIETLVTIAARLGVASLRAPLLALRVARAACALRGGSEVAEEDIAEAARFVLAPRATMAPADQHQPPQEAAEESTPDDSEDQRRDDRQDDRQDDQQDHQHDSETPEETTEESPPVSLEDVILAAAAAAIPKDLLARIQAGTLSRAKSERGGKAGSAAASAKRGRPIGARSGQLRDGRLGLVETLRAAAPWQAFRRKMTQGAEPRRVLVHPEDFRIRRFRERRETTAIFVVDASGSAAMQRLAEVKGAIELLLADCYVRRDNVALVTFRGAGAEIALSPTRSLTRAKRQLAGLPGGGGTPLAAGLDAAVALAESLRRKGQSPMLVLMTDGRANICRDGQGGRARALEEALTAGRKARDGGLAALAIDTAPAIGRDPEPPTMKIAQAMNARYVKLPYVNAAGLSEAIRAAAPAH